MTTVLVTGGAGFIGSAVIRRLLESTPERVVNLDKLTYAANPDAIALFEHRARYALARADIADASAVRALLEEHRPRAVIHLAAESHVDRSIDAPAVFVQTNVVGTFTLLQESLRHWRGLSSAEQEAFRFLHVSTDEVFGSLTATERFSEASPYAPNSPYSASKAASDFFVRAWHHTYGLPVITTNCSNNYGPYQFPEKLIPLTILNGVAGRPLPVYGRGENVRDWLYVEDHVEALLAVLDRGRVGETYAIGGRSEHRNIDVVTQVCDLLDELAPSAAIGARRSLIRFVSDRPGHDLRYAIDCSKISGELGWTPRETFDSGLRRTVHWYLDHGAWCEGLHSGAYRGERLGVGVQSP